MVFSTALNDLKKIINRESFNTNFQFERKSVAGKNPELN